MMHRVVLIAAFALATASMAIAAPAASAPVARMKVAVAEFQVKGEAAFKDAGRIVPEWLIGALAKTGAFDVVERVLLDKVLEEQGLALSGLVSGGGPKAGALVGADAVVAGSVISWAGSLSITARLIDSTTGEVLKSATLEGSSVQGLPAEMDGVAKVLAGLQPASSLVKRPETGVKAKEYPVSVVRATLKGGKTRIVLDRGLEDGIQKQFYFSILVPIFDESEVTGERVRIGMKRIGMVGVDYVEPNFSAGNLNAEVGYRSDADELVTFAVAVPMVPATMGMELQTLNLGLAFGVTTSGPYGAFGFLSGWELASESIATLGGLSMAIFYSYPVLGNFISSIRVSPGLGGCYSMGLDYPFHGDSVFLNGVGGEAFVDIALGGFFARVGARGLYYFGELYDPSVVGEHRYIRMIGLEPFVSVGYRLNLNDLR